MLCSDIDIIDYIYNIYGYMHTQYSSPTHLISYLGVWLYTLWGVAKGCGAGGGEKEGHTDSYINGY